jgi:beta-galactosidase
VNDDTEVTRREFVRAAMAAAAAGLGITLIDARAGAQAAAEKTQGQTLATGPVDWAIDGGRASVKGPAFPYGAVYFRKSNPPAEDWARDHATAARVGMNTFRHWFLWSAIEVAPGKFDWADYDRMMDLAAANGLKVIVAEFTTCAPEWAFRQYAHARYLANDGTRANSEIGSSTAVGGFPGLCLDNADARAAAERFLTALVLRYREHPALLGYDIWNENSYDGGAKKMNCYCEATQTRLREWLKAKYGTLAAAGKAWGRYSWASWEDVEAPESLGGYAEGLDWLEFRVDDAFWMLKWRVDLFRRLDPHHLICAHGVAGTLETLGASAHNEWRSAAMMDVWGLTWVASRHGNAPWMQFQAMDLARAGAREKPFWHAEAEGGPLWMQPQVIGHVREDGRQPDAEDVRIWNLISCAAGARGILYPRWRPLLDGPLFGAFGPFAMDGSVTPRAEMAGKVATWANGHSELWRSKPVKGEVGLVFVPEAELFNTVQQGEAAYYAQSMKGAYQACFDQNIQADFVALENIAEYKLVYLAYPVMLKPETVKRLVEYVRGGGTLVCEGCPGYFGEHGHVGTVQPNMGLDALFGAREKFVEFDPDLSEQLTLEVQGRKVFGRYFRQEYELMGGTSAGTYADGSIAAVENALGNGRTLLMGTFPAAGYYLHHGAATRELFAGFLKMAGVTQQVKVSDAAVQARLHVGQGGAHVWVTNPTREAKMVEVTVSDAAAAELRGAEDVWGGAAIAVSGRSLKMTVPARDAVVAELSSGRNQG